MQNCKNKKNLHLAVSESLKLVSSKVTLVTFIPMVMFSLWAPQTASVLSAVSVLLPDAQKYGYSLLL